MDNKNTNIEPDYNEEDAPLLRKIIAKRMIESKVTNPHFYLTVDVDVKPLIEYRKTKIENLGKKVSYNDILMKAISNVLIANPECNVSYIDDKIRTYQDVNICLAVAVKNGLLTPAVRKVQEKSISQINTDSQELVNKARMMRLRPKESVGGTFTLSNLGMFGIEDFSAIINTPQALILAVGAMREVPVVSEGKIVIGYRMKMTLSCDHKIVDGATGATFLSELKTIVENPVRIE